MIYLAGSQISQVIAYDIYKNTYENKYSLDERIPGNKILGSVQEDLVMISSKSDGFLVR